MGTEDAIRIRQNRRARVRRIRGRVVGYSVALFMVVWAVIAVVLVTGHDPALSRTTAAVASSAPSTASESSSDDGGSSGVSSSAGSSGSGFSAGTGSSSTGSSNATGSGTVSPVTSGQS